jgi:hypothetical protein
MPISTLKDSLLEETKERHRIPNLPSQDYYQGTSAIQGGGGPGRTMLQQDPSAHVYWESLIVEAKRPRAQNWCCFYRPRRGVSHTRIGYALSLICMFLI